MRLLQVCGFLVIAGTLTAAAAPGLDPSLGVIFPAEHARDLLKQCSRETPQPVDATWTPDAAQIVKLERGFPAAFAKAVAARKFYRSEGLIQQMDKYGRQYGGIVLKGRKLIYVNGFLAQVIDFDGTDLAKQMFPDWHHKAAMICDGGPSNFGAEFDPDMETFAHFAFNGVP